jgi:outer membrane protein assembly factor BamB
MKFNRVLFFVLAAIVSILLTACGAAPLTNWPGIVTDGKNVYMADGQYSRTIKVSDGTPITAPGADGALAPVLFPPKADGNIVFYGTPAITSDGQLIFGNASTQTNVHTLYSTDPLTGATKWTFTDATSTWMAGPVVSGDTIYAANDNGTLYAFDLKGKKRWETSVSTDALWSSPVVSENTVYIGTLAHDIIALDTATGKQRWKQNLDNAIIGPPAISTDGTLYVGTISGNLYAFNAKEGSKVWATTLQGGIWSTPALDGTNLYIGTADGTAGKFYILNAADGKPVHNPIDETGSVIGSPLVLKDKIVYVTEDGYINFIDKKGDDVVAPIKIENAKIYTAPVLAGDLILIAPMNAEFVLAAYNQNGVQQWKFIPK